MPIKYLSVLLLALGLAACSTVDVQSKKDKTFDFSSLQHFSWSNLGSDIDPKVGSGTGDADEILRREITRNFEKRGYEFVRQEEAEFLLTYQVTIEKRLDERVLDSGANTGTGWGNQNIDEMGYNKKAHATYIIEYSEGSLIIEARQTGTNLLFWRGVAVGEVHEEYSEAQSAERMREAVASVVKSFPAR
ncbi:MAG: DUF4136 domain-containing protein [Gammaproteobacteria bacterium]|nr:DUF4136 domain-containing protein [Gammaproteobacteria bacterium]